MCRESKLKRSGSLVNATRVSVSPGVFCQDAQAVFLPHPRNWDVVPHPVSAWKSGNARDLEGPRWVRMSWMGFHGFFCHCLNTLTVLRGQVWGKSGWQEQRHHWQLYEHRLSRGPVLQHVLDDNRLAKQNVLSDKWRAVIAQTAWCRSNVLSAFSPIILGSTKGSGMEDKSFAEKSGN